MIRITLADANGRTWEEFVAESFQFEYCEECGGDGEDHLPCLVLGNWFAMCKFTPLEKGVGFRHGEVIAL